MTRTIVDDLVDGIANGIVGDNTSHSENNQEGVHRSERKMDIKDIKEMKAGWESEIRAILVMFERQSEMVVEDVKIMRHHDMGTEVSLLVRIQ